MLQWIIGSSIKNRILVAVAAGAILATGIARLPDVQVEALPDFGPVRVEVQTEALGLSPEEAENLITNPMEQEFFTGIPWLHKITSNTAQGLSSIEMIFDPGTNDVRARQVVQERLTMVPALPAVSKPPFVIQPTATVGRLMLITMSSKDMSLVDMSTLARWRIRQRLLSVPGVAKVSIWGLRDRQLQVLIDPHRLRINRLKVEDVVRTAANAMWSSPLTHVEASTPGTGGFIDTSNQRISINHTQPIKTAADLTRIAVDTDSPVTVPLGEVADLVEGHQLLIGDAIVNGGTGLVMVVERSPGTSIAAVTRDVEKALDAMRPGLTGIAFDTSAFRAASFVETARANLAGSVGIGLLLAVLAIGAFFFNWRAALISLTGMSLSLVAAWMVLAYYGQMLNMMIIAGLVLALAIVVDDAVVVLESIRRRLATIQPPSPSRERERLGGRWDSKAEESASIQTHPHPSLEGEGTEQLSAFDLVAAGMKDVCGPLLTGLAIVLISITPVLALTDVTGDFAKPLTQAYALTTAVSMLVAFTVTAALAALLLTSPAASAGDSRFARSLREKYPGALLRSLKKPELVIWAAAIVVIAGILLLPHVFSTDLVPPLKDRNIAIGIRAAPGTSLPAMTQITTAINKELRAIPGVASVNAHIGRASQSDIVSNVDRADLWVRIGNDADYDSSLAAIKKALSANASVSSEVGTYANRRVRELTNQTGDNLVVRVYGHLYPVLQEKAEAVAKSIAEIPGVVAPRLRLPVVEPAIEVEVNVDKASAKGVKPGDARRAAATLVSSLTVGQLFEGQKIFDVVVWGQPSIRASVQGIKDVLIDAPDNSQVRLGDIADVRVRTNPSIIKHDAVSRYIDVTARTEGASIAAVNEKIEERLEKISFPAEHHVELLSESDEHEHNVHALLFYTLGAMVVIFFVLQARLNSWRLATLLSLALLFPSGAAILGAATQGSAASILSLFGVLAILGLAARGGMLFFERCQMLEREGGMAFGSAQLVQRAAQERFDAAMLGAMAAILALLPLLLYGTVTGLEIVKPMAAIIIAGLVATLLANLFLLPVLYRKFAVPADTAATGAQGAADL